MKELFKKLFGIKKKTFIWKLSKRDNGTILTSCYYTKLVDGRERGMVESTISWPGKEVKRTKKMIEKWLNERFNVVPGGAWEETKDAKWDITPGIECGIMTLQEKYVKK